MSGVDRSGDPARFLEERDYPFLCMFLVRSVIVLIHMIDLGSRVRIHILFAVLICVTLGGCWTSDSNRSGVDGGTTHPILDKIPNFNDFTYSIETNPDGLKDETLDSYVRAMRNVNLSIEIGKREGRSEYMIGKVQDIAIGKDGSIHVLDSRNSQIRIYSSDGQYISSFGRPGSGPMEFVSPETITIIDRDHIVVADRLVKVKVFGPTKPFSLLHTIALSYTPEDVCTLHDIIYVQGLRVGQGSVHSFSLKGDSLKSFGPLYDSDNSAVTGTWSTGDVACSDITETVMFAFDKLPVLYGYTPDGNFKFASKLTDFEMGTTRSVVSEEGQSGIQWEETDYNRIHSLEAIPDSPVVIVQVALHTRESRDGPQEYEELLTYVVNSATGKGRYVGDHLPTIHAIDNNRIYCGVNYPYPKLEIYNQ